MECDGACPVEREGITETMRGRVAVPMFLLLICACLPPPASPAHRWDELEVSANGICRYWDRVDCCLGWRRESWGQCRPVCELGCKHGDCVGPDQCRCHSGYTGKTCNQDVNECGLKPRPCKHRCMNLVGTYKCYCLNGHMMMPDGTCRNARTCALAHCQYGCAVMKGEVVCQCPSPGLRLGPDRRTCVDIDECVTGVARCPRFRKCENTFGSYICKCHKGFELRYINGKYHCTDKNDLFICRDKPDSKKCRCKPGANGWSYDCKPPLTVTIDPARPPKPLKPTTTITMATVTTTTSHPTTSPTTTSSTTTTIATTTTIHTTTTPTTTPTTIMPTTATTTVPTTTTPTTTVPTTTPTTTVPTTTPTTTVPTTTPTTTVPTTTPTTTVPTTTLTTTPTTTTLTTVPTTTPTTTMPTTTTPTTVPTTTTPTTTVPTTTTPTTVPTTTPTTTMPTTTTPTTTVPTTTTPTTTVPTTTTPTTVPTTTTPTTTVPTTTTPTTTMPTTTTPTTTVPTTTTPTTTVPTTTITTTVPTTFTTTTLPTTTTTTVTTTTELPSTTTQTPTGATTTTMPITTTLDNHIQEITQRPRGDVHIPRNREENIFHFFDVELGNTAEFSRDDPGAHSLSCSFDQGVCSWMKDQDGDLHWESVTDPAGGRYLIVPEPKIGRSFKGARLTIPLAPPTMPPWSGGDLCVGFRHRLQGLLIGSLQLFVKKGRSQSPAVWTRSNGHGWRHTHITLSGRGLQSVVFKGERRRGRSGEIAIDDVRLQRGSCSHA